MFQPHNLALACDLAFPVSQSMLTLCLLKRNPRPIGALLPFYRSVAPAQIAPFHRSLDTGKYETTMNQLPPLTYMPDARASALPLKN